METKRIISGLVTPQVEIDLKQIIASVKFELK